MIACPKNSNVTSPDDHSSHGILNAGTPNRNAESMKSHFKNCHRDSVSS